MTYRIANLAELRNAEGWAAVRRELGVSAFGINSWTAAEDGAAIISEHAESQSGQEELYLVLEGHATFSVDGEEVDAPTGTLVHVADPALRRGATGTAGRQSSSSAASRARRTESPAGRRTPTCSRSSSAASTARPRSCSKPPSYSTPVRPASSTTWRARKLGSASPTRRSPTSARPWS